MSIIKGRFIYHAYYNTVSEMKADKELELGYYVAVVNGIHMNAYKIVDKIIDKGAVYETLNNGLYALSVIITNETVVDLTKPYKTTGPVEKTVGQIQEGTQFTANDTNDVFDLLFYHSWVNVEVSSNFEEPLIKGEQNILTKLYINITRSTEVIVKTVIRVDDYEVTIDDHWGVGEHEVDLDVIVRETTDVDIEFTSQSHLIYTKIYSLEMDYPCYYSSIGAAVEPTAITIKQMLKSFDKVTEYTDNYNNTRFFVAVPNTKKLVSLKDENEDDLMDNLKKYTKNITHGLDTILYNCYYIPTAMLASGFKFSFEVEDV